MKVAIYIRVSTKMQEDRYSLAAQERELTDYANKMGWTIIDKPFKDIESGGKLDKKGLNALLDAVEDHLVDVVLVVDQDRLSRLDTVEWEYLKDILRENKVKIAEPGNITDLSNEDQEFISDIKNLIAKREKRAIVRRMMRGKRERTRQGKAWGKAPMGYIYNKEFNYDKDPSGSPYIIDEKWSWVIPFIDDLYLNKNLGMKAIADEVNKISKTPNGRYWNEKLICDRLTSKTYHGVMEKKFSTGEVITIDDAFPALRTKETWKQIQTERRIRASQFKADKRNNENPHMLRRTLITCGHCGRKINIENHNSKATENVWYYLKHGRKLKISDRSVCDISINTIRVDHNIIKALSDILTNEEQAKKYIKLDVDPEEIKTLKKEIKQTEKAIQESNEGLDRLLDLYVAGRYAKEKLLQKEQEIENTIKIHNKVLEEKKAKLGVLEKKSWNYDLIINYMVIARSINKDLTPHEKMQLVGRLFPTASLYEDKLILIADFGFPVEIEIKIDENPYTWHHQNKR